MQVLSHFTMKHENEHLISHSHMEIFFFFKNNISLFLSALESLKQDKHISLQQLRQGKCDKQTPVFL